MRLVHAGVLDDGGGQEQEGRNLVEGESVLVSGRGCLFGGLVSTCSLSTVIAALIAERISRAGRAVKRSAQRWPREDTVGQKHIPASQTEKKWGISISRIMENKR